MVNLSYLFHPSCCGYYCLKHVIRKAAVKRIRYMNLYEMKEEFLKNYFYCFCCRVNNLDYVKRSCITLMKTKTNFHYIVIKKIDDRFVYCYDPLFLFIRKVSKDKFLKKWGKICLFYNKI